jgi:hypothetical protein
MLRSSSVVSRAENNHTRKVTGKFNSNIGSTRSAVRAHLIADNLDSQPNEFPMIFVRYPPRSVHGHYDGGRRTNMRNDTDIGRPSPWAPVAGRLTPDRDGTLQLYKEIL